MAMRVQNRKLHLASGSWKAVAMREAQGKGQKWKMCQRISSPNLRIQARKLQSNNNLCLLSECHIKASAHFDRMGGGHFLTRRVVVYYQGVG